MKTVRIILICVCVAAFLYFLGRAAFAFWFVDQPEKDLQSYVTNLNEIETWRYDSQNADEYPSECIKYEFDSCFVDKLDSAKYNSQVGCFLWDRRIGKNYYEIAICPETKEAYTHTYCNLLFEKTIDKFIKFLQ